MKSAKMIKHLFHPASLGLALAALVSLLLVGCGDLNDNPYQGGLSVQVDFSNMPQPAPSNGGMEEQSITFTGTGEEVLSVVLGAIVITHTATPYSNVTVATLLDETQRELLETDAEQSVQYLEIIQLPYPEDSVSFPIPPETAGNWQLVAVGMRHSIATLGEIENNSPIWYGFIDQFLNGVAQPGQVLDKTLTLVPGCLLDDPPLNVIPPC